MKLPKFFPQSFVLWVSPILIASHNLLQVHPWTVTTPLSFVFLSHHHHWIQIVSFSQNAILQFPYPTKPFCANRSWREKRFFLESMLLQRMIMLNHQIGLSGSPQALSLLIRFSDWFPVLPLVPLDSLYLPPPRFFTLSILGSNW